MTVETLDTAPMALEHEDARDSRRLGFSLTLPAQLLVLFIAVFPILMQVYISLTDWSPLDGIGWWQAHQLWNNFANYTDLAADDRFWSALGRTALVMAICVPVEFLLGLGLAILFVDNFPAGACFTLFCWCP
jgi:multiple sugar transport system permease protein